MFYEDDAAGQLKRLYSIGDPAGSDQVSYANPSGARTAFIWFTTRDALGNTLTRVIHQAYAIAN